ncbi:MAG TPA: DNA topoisomerase I [Methanothermococcus okinawensis]|uniref:DNA topoisomerase 1 n=1 Tax=Methanothermococcus okinawensis TaxID=155863 RepID=A0A832ZCE9_9EURY|nr:DNA topoisomerase I [Methanothermococcus okinawensis]HIP90790.1 DNA topoisomerase I [Methanothermococcus okinawensis]
MKKLIICEKPKVAKKIGEALGKAEKRSYKGVPYYQVERNGEKIIVASAVGHLFALEEDSRNRRFGEYPVFHVKWVPAYILKGREYVKKYVETLKRLSRDVEDIYIATDWDIEGELIGYHALYYICGRRDGKRMRFSSLTGGEIVRAYENPDRIDFGLVDAGESRHTLDWYYGINVSRALMQSLKAVNRWRTMSTGRVQGPALAFLVERELEIKKFKSKKYWVIEGLLEGGIKAIHAREKFWDEGEAKEVYNKIMDKRKGVVLKVRRRERSIKPLPPFDLGTLQREAYRIYKLSPKETQEIAQRLYEQGYCSYPRTSSQRLPDNWEYLENILKKIKKIGEYRGYVERILKECRKPVKGKKEDPAHPAIHVVDVPKEPLTPKGRKIYDLIARRTLGAFWDDMRREYVDVHLDIGGELFKVSGARTLYKGWQEIYYFTNVEEKEIPNFREGEVVAIEKIVLEERETKPPKRYTLSSIIKELEKRGLGTKSTRAEIVEKLIKRGYVIEERGNLKVTNLGMAVIETLKRYCPEIVEEGMTRDMEEKLEKVQRREVRKEDILKEAEERLRKILQEVKSKEVDIGRELIRRMEEDRDMNKPRICPRCGGRLVARRGKYGEFFGCSNYPRCRYTTKKF